MASVDIVIPVYNEEVALSRSIATLKNFLKEHASFSWRIVIADNASTDKTLDIAKELSEQDTNVTYVHLDLKGRGRALKKAWLESDADIVSYMDVDLSTELEALPLLVNAIEDGYGVAIGSRLIRDSEVIGRSLKREITSRGYNLLIKLIFSPKFADAQCGFKAVRIDVVKAIVPYIENNEWFFDTELLLLTTKKGYRIKEIPVKWTDDPDTRVDVVKTAIEDIKGLLRVRFRPPF